MRHSCAFHDDGTAFMNSLSCHSRYLIKQAKMTGQSFTDDCRVFYKKIKTFIHSQNQAIPGKTIRERS